MKDLDILKRENSNKKESNNYNSNMAIDREKIEQGREWLDKLNKDLDDIDRHTSKANPKTINDSSRIDKSMTLKDNYSGKHWHKMFLILSNIFYYKIIKIHIFSWQRHFKTRTSIS